MEPVEPIVDPVQLRIHFVESPVDLFKPLIDLFESPVDLVETLIDVLGEIVQPLVGPALSHVQHDARLGDKTLRVVRALQIL